MGFLSELGRMLVGAPPRELSLPDLETQAERIWSRVGNRAWTRKSVTDALGVPAILSAVSLISGTVGRLTLDAYRDGTRLAPEKIPQLLVKPNPLSTPNQFWMLTAFYQATRGEFWWFVAHRDSDGNPDALYPVPPWEVKVESNPSNRLAPKITWLGKVRSAEDMRHQIYLPDPNDSAGVRGVGPLQLAGAAVSVAVEADIWAGNFFSGSIPSMVGSTDQDLDENDLIALNKQWLEKDNNVPRWMTNGMHLETPPFDPEKAQLTETRQHSVGEVARMFLMPGPLLEYQMQGQSLTYRNESDIWTDFQQRCLTPKYLEPIQQEMTALTVRSLKAEFNTWELTKADIKTRFDVYESGITKSGVLTVQDAQRMEGLAAGDVNYAPVPPAPPASVPDVIPMQMSLGEWRCSSCRRKLAEEQGSGTVLRCRCGTLNVGQAHTLTRPEAPPPQVFVFNALPTPGAPQVHMTNEAPNFEGLMQMANAMLAIAEREQMAPQVTVEAPQVHVDVAAAEGPRVEVYPPPITLEAPQVHVNVEPAPVPNVEVHPAPITVEAPNVTVNVPEPRSTSKRLERDKANNIIRIIEEPA